MMSTGAILAIIAGYFALLVITGLLTSKKGDNEEFFKANQSSPWFLVAFGMIGVSLSGVTFLSVPGAVKGNSFSYLQMVLGNVLGYWLIIWILLPLYYKMNLTSIYAYLGERFGGKTRKTGSAFFLLSRTVGASLRLYLVAIVLQAILFKGSDMSDSLSFIVTVGVIIALIWIYTQKGGIKTIVWTDTLQTFFMLAGLFGFVFWLSGQLGGVSQSLEVLNEKGLSQIFFWDPQDGKFFVRGFLTGVFITLVMNGLDQDMMQKNLTCRNLKDAKKNIFTLSIIFLIVNIVFVFLGGLLTVYAEQNGIAGEKDKLFTAVAQASESGVPVFLFVIFLLGVIAAAYSSADSALTSLTTAFCVDFVKLDEMEEAKKIKIRRKIHIVFSVILFNTIIIFKSFNDDSIVWMLFKAAGLTYGPLLGMYSFGLFTKRKVIDTVIPFIAVASTIISWFLLTFGEVGFEILIYNGVMTFTAMLALSKSADEQIENSTDTSNF